MFLCKEYDTRNDLLEIPCPKDLNFVSFDITNMYSKVPVAELIEIIKLICNHNGLIEELNQEVTKYFKILTQQNYFQYKDLQWGTRGAVGCGTGLQARRSRVPFPMVLLKFVIDVVLPVLLWPWG
jgi:hypothetical protein